MGNTTQATSAPYAPCWSKDKCHINGNICLDCIYYWHCLSMQKKMLQGKIRVIWLYLAEMGQRGSSTHAPVLQTPLTGERIGLWLYIRQDWCSGLDITMGYSEKCDLAISSGHLVFQRTHILCPLPSPSGLLPSPKKCSCCTPCTSYFTPVQPSPLDSGCACPFHHSRSSSGMAV